MHVVRTWLGSKRYPSAPGYLVGQILLISEHLALKIEHLALEFEHLALEFVKFGGGNLDLAVVFLGLRLRIVDDGRVKFGRLLDIVGFRETRALVELAHCGGTLVVQLLVGCLGHCAAAEKS